MPLKDETRLSITYLKIIKKKIKMTAQLKWHLIMGLTNFGPGYCRMKGGPEGCCPKSYPRLQLAFKSQPCKSRHGEGAQFYFGGWWY